jgi:hypothetical protein
MTDTVESLDAEIKDMNAQVEALYKKITRKSNKRDKLLIQANEHRFDDIEWLINNPTMPGQYEAMEAWLTKRFGREWMGVNASGYYPSINQQAFSLTLHDTDEVAKKVENIRAFFAECLQYFKAAEDGYVSFTYTTGEHSGIFQLAYRPDSKTWWTTNTRYHHMYDERKYPDLDAAIVGAQLIAKDITD